MSDIHGETPFSQPPPQQKNLKYNGHNPVQSVFIKMRDGVDLAAEIILPKNISPNVRIPTLLSQTCYWRHMQLKPPAGWFYNGLACPKICAIMASRGFAHVFVDIRGTGASFGVHSYPFCPEEIADARELVSWIVQQPWSDGNVIPWGGSYLAASAEYTVSHNHPAVKGACLLHITNWDTYQTLFPGGVCCKYFVDAWSTGGRWQDQMQDLDAWITEHPEMATILRLIKGVKPVIKDRLPKAIAEHAGNHYLSDVIIADTALDDLLHVPGIADDNLLRSVSAYMLRNKIQHSRVPLLIWGSWGDGNTANNVLARFLNLTNPLIAVIGDWDHGANFVKENPFFPQAKVEPPLLVTRHVWADFFDRVLAGQIPSEKILYYYTIGEEKWKSTRIWPPSPMTYQSWYCSDHHGLNVLPPQSEIGADEYRVDFSTTTGKYHRWSSLLGISTRYPDRTIPDQKLLVYTSPPLDQDLEITGHPIVDLSLACTHPDGALFVYLECVTPDGTVRMLTEGYFRLIHRKLSPSSPPYHFPVPYHTFHRSDMLPMRPGKIESISFDLFPLSALIRQGMRLRLAIAGADDHNFARYPPEGSPIITLSRTQSRSSCIQLPIIPR